MPSLAPRTEQRRRTPHAARTHSKQRHWLLSFLCAHKNTIYDTMHLSLSHSLTHTQPAQSSSTHTHTSNKNESTAAAARSLLLVWLSSIIITYPLAVGRLGF